MRRDRRGGWRRPCTHEHAHRHVYDAADHACGERRLGSDLVVAAAMRQRSAEAPAALSVPDFLGIWKGGNNISYLECQYICIDRAKGKI